jgi:hypothetical protein
MHLLPLSLFRLAEHADRIDTARFALNGVLLRVCDDNTFEAVATDGKVLSWVTGPCVGPPEPRPEIPDFDTTPDGGSTAIVPADAWKRAFGWARKLAAKAPPDNPSLRSVAVRIGTALTTFGASAGEYGWCESVENVIGRYPPYTDVIPPRGTGRDRFRVDPGLLSELLRTAAAFSPNDLPSVDIETHGEARPVVVRARTPGGVEFVGLVMPLVPDPAATVPPADDADRVHNLQRLCTSLLAERDTLARRVAELEAALAATAGPGIASSPPSD